MKQSIATAFFLVFLSAGFAQELPYTDGRGSWDEDSLGNHRAVVECKDSGRFARVSIPWRRPDTEPEKKGIIIQDARTGKKVNNIKILSVDNHKGEMVFEPISGKGEYYVYYMPYKNEGRANYPKGVYLSPEQKPATDWLLQIPSGLPQNTRVTRLQSIDSLNSFYPMEVIATRVETEALVKQSGVKDYLVFPEVRAYPIRMQDRLPYRWIKSGPRNAFLDKAKPGEQYSYQLGLYAITSLENITVKFTALKAASGASIPDGNISCINTAGIDYAGKPFTKTLSVSQGQVQPLWVLVNIPKGLKPGKYTGTATISGKNVSHRNISIQLDISGSPIEDGGISTPWLQTRLHWLNSTIYQDNTVIAPYTAIQVKGNDLSILGRTIQLDESGLPRQILSFFTREMTGIFGTATPLLASPLQFNILSDVNKKPVALDKPSLAFIRKSDGTVVWSAQRANSQIAVDITGALEFDGYLNYQIRIKARTDLSLADINLQMPFRSAVATHMLGLGQKGGKRPNALDWKWDVATKNQDGAWIGTVNAGLHYSLRDENYVRPLNTNFYLQKPLLLPVSWGNSNKGGISIKEAEGVTWVNNYSGERRMKAGEELHFNITLLITPFHPINTEAQWQERYYHRYSPIDTIKAAGSSVVNIHHANAINPWINYPFIEFPKMKDYIVEAHAKGVKVKIYNTVREVSNHAYETFPLRSLGHEIYSPGKGGGFSWLQEHLRSDYIAAWFVPGIKDAAIVNSGMSRWHNYYIEGIHWLVNNVGIDGLYLDDVAFDRITMKRVKRALTQDGHPGIIDLHSANQFNRNDGFNNSANLYLEHFPYLNRLWFGEYFDYEKNDPDFFLTEVSGIPFGLMGEMLENDGNPWRGMIYGMTSRNGYTKHSGPGEIWKVWDSFGIQGSSMIGYWSPECPVKTSQPDMLATVYKKEGKAMVAIASWAGADSEIQLQIDWKKLGIDAARAKITAPAIRGFQPEKSFSPTARIPVEKGKGWLLIIE